MIISDLNHLEAVSQTVEVNGGISLANFLASQGFTLTAFSENTQIIGNKTVTSAAGILEANGTTVAFATSSSVESPLP